MLLYLPGSVTCTTDFSSFTSLLNVYCFWGGVSYFPGFPKLLISRHVAFVEIRLGGWGKGLASQSWWWGPFKCAWGQFEI